ncbi:twin-arginine translocase TatA/TatE family subunit [Candidatus Saccharibacteria bacterium]|nr:MAG: twin-arginine translocase TatA/TatE family subunit [Candidatus Saccharibacteria bacterium]
MFTQFAILDLSTGSLLILLAIVLLLFGSKKLPELSKSLGESARELRKGMNNEEDKKKQADSSKNENQA